MEKQLEVMRMIQGLAETTLEGIEHMQKLFGEGKPEQTMYLFEDVLVAFSTIERSLDSMEKVLTNQGYSSHVQFVKKTLELTVSAYEEKNNGKVQEILQFTLRPQFKKLKEELEQVFQPYLLS